MYARVLLGATFLLVIAGGLVTSTDSGLSVPDWPTTYGSNMFTFPMSKWVGGIRFEHSHRLIAAAVGLMTILLLVWTLIAREPRFRRILAAVALGTVMLQGVLGGLTVRYLLPTPISVAHACLAQTFFCLVVAIVILSPRASRTAGSGAVSTPVPAWGLAAFCVVYVQLILGAWMRHSNAALAIPDFPTSFGGVLPDRWDSRIAINFAHRVWAIVVAAVLISVAVRVLRGSAIGARGAARVALVLLPVQIFLGALSIWSRRAVIVTVAHVATGALLLGTTVWLTLRLYEARAGRVLSQPVRLPAAAAGGMR